MIRFIEEIGRFGMILSAWSQSLFLVRLMLADSFDRERKLPEQ
jgi:hypothetical protein